MRGLEFQHRVMQPWKRDPAFYSTTNLGFGPKMQGAFGIPQLPLDADKAKALAAKLNAVPGALNQARANLTDARGDLARLAIVQKQVEENVFGELAASAAKLQPGLAAPARHAQAAAAEFKAWLESIEAGLPTHGGVGKENYAWYLKNVLLLPYTPEQVEVIGEREYQRQVAFLKIEEHRNRAIAMPEPVTTRAQFDAKRQLTFANQPFLRLFGLKPAVLIDPAPFERLLDLARDGGRILGRAITEVITVNGVRVALEDGSWVLVRASSNKPEIVVVVESTRSEDDMRALFREEVKPRLARRPEIGAYNQEI
jgi:hypothetical protein